MVKGFVVAVVTAALVVPLGLVAVPYIEFFNDLAVQNKVKPQMPWGRTLRLAPGLPRPDGTVPRNVFQYPFPLPRAENQEERKRMEAAVAEEATKRLAGVEPDIAPVFHPPRPTLPLLEKGRKRYQTFCAVCHGQWGLGDGPVPARGFPAPPSLLDQKVREYPDARIFHIITVGQGGVMPSYASALPPEERWAVVYYVRALQRAFPTPEVTP